MNLETKTLGEVVKLLEDALELLARCYARWDEYDQDDSPDLGSEMEDFLVLTGIIDKGRWDDE